jgi:predicted cobalt transporter CbtA
MSGRAKTVGTDTLVADRTRPGHFSTYVPRSVVRRLKVVATIRDMPLWALITLALEEYLERFQKKHGQLPTLDDGPTQGRE